MNMRLIMSFLFFLTMFAPSYTDGSEPVELAPMVVEQAIARHEQMSSLIKTDPAEFLRLAMSKEMRSKLPAQLQGLVEYEIKVTGTLEILHEDWPDGARYYWFVKNGSQTYSLYIAGQPGEFYSGLNVMVKGIGFEDKIAVYPSDIMAYCTGNPPQHLRPAKDDCYPCYL